MNELNSLENKLIINNDADRRNFNYLVSQVDQIAIEYAIAELKEKGKKPYLSNIFKLLEIKPQK